MPKNKFDAFYYGIGMKLDEASVDQAGKQLEGKLNKVVDNVTKNLTSISDAVAKGIKDVDTKKLVQSLVDARNELNQFENFDPSKLQKQIDLLNTTVTSLSVSLGDVSTQLKNFTDDVASRLSNIEIKTSKQGKDILKADLKEMKILAQGYSNILASGEKVDTSALDKYFQKIKSGFASLKASGNPMEMFTDKELANYFIDLTNILRKMGAPVEELRSDFFELTSAFKGAFEKSGVSGAQTIFKNIGYQIESTSAELRKAKAELADYEAQITKTKSRTKTTGFAITVDDDKDLNFEQKIKRIQEYGDIAAELDYGDEWAVATKNQIALIQAAEKELKAALKTSAGKNMFDMWQREFGKYDLADNKLSTSFITDYVNFAQQELERLQDLHAKTKQEVESFQAKIGSLQATEAATSSSKKTKQLQKTSTSKQKAEGVVAEVEAKVKINEGEWAKTINIALGRIEAGNKVKPFKIRVEATQGKILEEIKKIKEATLMDKKNNGEKDVVKFNDNFNKFIENLKTRKQELINELKQNWHPALKDAFAFRMEVLGLDKKSMTENIASNLLPLVDSINNVIESKPIIFHSNIDELVEEIKNKLQNIKIDIGAGNVNVGSQGLSNINLIINGISSTGNNALSIPFNPSDTSSTNKKSDESSSTKTSKKSKDNDIKANAIQTAEKQMADELRAGKTIVENYIKLAKWAKALSPIAEGADIKIKESDFNNTDTINRRGKTYTKRDVGTTIPGRKITFEDLDSFISEYENSENEEDKQLFGFLKNLIDAHKGNQQRLNTLLNELSGSDIISKYNNADNKTEFLAKDVKSSYKTIMSAKGSKRAQQHLTDIFGKYNIDLSELPSAKTYAEQWQIIEQQIIGREGLDFDSLMSELGSLKGNVGKTYENFMTLLKVSRNYMLASNSLSAIGQEASNIMRGTKSPKAVYRKEWDNTIGRWHYTDEQIGVKQELITEGLRQEIGKLAVVFMDKFGNATAGFNAGKNIADDYLSSSSASYSKIIKFLSNAMEQAAQIAFAQHRGGIRGYQGVTKWVAPQKKESSEQPYVFTSAMTEKSQIENYIKGTQYVIDSKQNLKNKLLEENKQIQQTISALESKNNRTEKENKELQLLKTTLQTNNQTIAEATDEIKRQQSRLQKLKDGLKNADTQNVTYKRGNFVVGYDQAKADLPYVKSATNAAKSELTKLERDFALQYVGFADGLSKKELDKATPQLKIPKFNQQYLSGELKREEYIKKVEDAYILLEKAETEEAQTVAKANAKKIIDATTLIKKYQEEEKILNRIIRTQKPKEQPVTQSISRNNSRSQDKTQETTQPTGGRNISRAIGGVTSVGANDNIVMNVTGSGLATEGTVRAIYNLLSIKKNGDTDSKIEEIKNAIAIKEKEERAKAEEVKKAEEVEQKKVEENKKKANENAQKKTESDIAEKIRREKEAKLEGEKRVNEEKKRTEEVSKQLTNEKKKTLEDQKQVASEKIETQESQKQANYSQQRDLLNPTKQVLNKEIENLFASAHKTYQETSIGNKVFRELTFGAKNNIITNAKSGLMASAPIGADRTADTFGHLHPRNSLYSSSDINNMINLKSKTPSYNKDILVTPDFVFQLEEMKDVSTEALKKLGQAFNMIEKTSNIGPQLSMIAKESILHNFAQENNLSFTKGTYDNTGNITDITQNMTILSKDVLNILKEYSQAMSAKSSTNGEYAELYKTRQQLREQLMQDPTVSAAMTADEGIVRGARGQKVRAATLIQEAVDYDFDLSLFIKQFKDFFVAIDHLGERVQPNSSLGKIRQAITELESVDKGSDKYQGLINQIQDQSVLAFGKSDTRHIDDRFLGELRSIAKFDTSGKINKTIDSEMRANRVGDTLHDENISNYANMTISELKTELARLEGLRDSGEVDPRFATAEKQDVIINLLKNGIKVSNGKSSGSESSSDETSKKTRLPQMPNITKPNLQAEEINQLTNINRDSALYKQYEAAKKQLDDTVASVVAKGKDRTKEDTDEIRALSSTVTSLGKQIINSSNAFEQFKNRGGEAFAYTKNEAKSLEDEMRELAHNDALQSNSLLRDISYDEATQKLSYSLTDLEGNITRVTMAYNELLGVALKTSDKTTTSASKIYNAIEGEMTQRVGVNNIIDETPILSDSQQYKNYIATYDSMIKKQDDLRIKGTMASKEEKNELTLLIGKVQEARREFEKLVQASSNFDAKIGSGNKKENVDYNNLESEMKEFVLSQEGLTKSQKAMIESTWSFKNAQDGATYSVIKGKDQVASMAVIFDQGTRRIGQYTVETNKYRTDMEKFLNSLKGKWHEVARYFMSFGSLYRVWAVLKRGVQYIKEIDSALTELKKVTDETEEAYDRFLNTAAKMADRVGSTIKEIVSSTADWARLGYSLEEATSLAESTSVLLNVSEFQGIEDATSALTSTLQAFSYTADESMHVVDVLNEVGNNFAISSDGIATALQDSASSLMAANNSYEEAVALIASANRVVQDPNSVGAALRTISLRLRGTSVKELEEAGEDTAGVITSKSKLRGKVRALSGVDILTDTGSYKSTYDILLEISKVWEDMSDIDQAALLEIIAGKTRSNTAAAILSNTTDLEEAYEQALEAEGSALAENEKYLDSIQGRLDLFNNTVQTMWYNALDSDAVKFFVNIGTQLVKWVDNLGLIKTLFMVIGTILVKKYFKGDLIGGLFGGSLSEKNVKNAKVYLKELRSEIDKAQTAFNSNHSKDNEKYLNNLKNKYASYKDVFGPQIEAYDNLEQKLKSLNNTRQLLVNDLSNGQQYEDFLGSRMAAGYDDSAEALDKIHTKNERLKGQINQIDEEILNTENALNDTGNMGLKAGQKIKMGFKTAGKAVRQFGKEIVQSIAYMYVITTAVELLGTGIVKLIEYVSDTGKSFENLQEKFNEAKNEVDTITSDIKNLESELKTTDDRIEELIDQGTLTFVEQEELSRLKEVSEELRTQIGLKQKIQGSLQKGANDAAIIAANKYMDTSFANEKSRTEVQEDTAEDYELLGKLLGVVAIIGGLALSPFSGGTSLGATIAGTSLLGVGLAGGTIGSAVGSAVGGAKYDSEESVGEAIKNMNVQRDELIKARDEALAAYTDGSGSKEAYDTAEQKLMEYNANLANTMVQMTEYRNQIVSDWENALPEQQEQARVWGDILDAYNIEVGGQNAKSNAITRIFGKEASQELKDIKKEIEDVVTAEDWDGNLNLSDYFDNTQSLDELTARLYEMGIYVYEVENYFKDMAEAEKEAAEISLYGVVTDINKVTEGLEELNSAFEEVLETGSVTSKTLAELNEVFGTLGDSWDNYVNTMFSGVASTKEMKKATEELAKAFIDSKILTGEAISEYERMTYIIQLRNLGVTNAEEYINDKIQENAYKAIQSSATYDEDELKELWLNKDENRTTADWDKLTSDERDEFASKELVPKTIDLEKAQEIIDEYGFELKPRVKLPDDAPSNIKSELEALSNGGSVDLLVRPKVDSATMNAAGWETEDGKYATVDTSTYSNEDKTIAMNFTPILPNGEVLSPSELQKYAEEVIAGTREDDLGLQVGAVFTGENAIEDAENVANQIHLLHEQYLTDEVSGNEHVVDLLQDQIELTNKLNNLKKQQSDAKAIEDEIKAIDEMTAHYNKLVSKYGHESNWKAGYDLDPSEFMDAESAYNFISSDGNNYDKEEFIKDYNAWVALLSENGPYSELLTRKKELEAQLSNLNIDSEGNKQAIENLEKQIEDIDTKIEKEYTLDVELEFELQNKSELVDDIQSIFDTLVEAQKEYNDEGYLSVDTLQGLLELEPKYLALLIDENGNLNLNKDTLYQVAVARITDMKLKQQDMILYKAESLAAKGTIDALYEQIDATYGMSEAYDTMIERRLQNVRAILEERKTLKDGEEGKLDSSFNVDSYISSIQHQLNAVEVASRSSIDNIRNALSSSGNTEKAETQDALEKLQKKYEHQISNYENQQTYLQNIIDKLEAENKGVSKQYYEDQIAIEQKKLDLYTKQRTELLSLLNSTAKGTDEWFEIADALWEVEHNIQESTLSMVEFRQSIIDLYKTAFDDLDKSHGDKDNFLSDQQDYIDKYNELLELQNKPTSMASYQEQIAIEEEKMANNISELNDLRKTLADSMASGYVKEGSEEWVEMQESIRETEAAILDNQIAIEEYKKELKSLSVEAFELVRGAFSNKNDFLTSQQDYIEGYADYLEALNIDAPAELYDKLIEIEREKRNNNVANLVSARAQFAEIEAQGYTAVDEEWQDAYNQIIEIEKAIQDSDIAMAQWEQTLRDLDFEKFERFISRLNDVRSEIDHIRNLMDGEDVAFEDGSWTEEGITSLGLLYQQIQIAKQESEAYAKQIDELNKQYEAGSMSEEEYYERLQELKEGQWDAIEAYKDAEDAIVDMEEARINMIEEGINEEIEAYEELIELKKEELDAERDLYDFKKKIADQSEEIADLERKLASLAGSTDLADIAERRKLEKELRDAQEGLDDTYYTHSMDQQGQALDDELESFRDAKEEYLEMLRETLENTEELINEKISELLLNADVVLDTLDEISEEHGVNLSGLLMKPWQDASVQSTAFKDTTEFNLNSLINEDGIVTVFSEDVKFKMAETFGASSYAAESFGTTVNTVINGIQTTVYNSTSPLTANLRLPWENVTSQYGPINTFSTQAKGAINTALVEAQSKAQAMTSNLTSPWQAGSNAVNTFSTNVRNALNQAVNDSRNAANQINSNLSSTTPSYTANPVNNNNSNNNNSGNISGPNVKALQEILNDIFSANISADGIFGPQTEAALKKAQEQMAKFLEGYNIPVPINGRFDEATYRAMHRYIEVKINTMKNMPFSSATIGGGVELYTRAKNKIPAAFMYAKGTLGTKRDEFAITDESWIGEEITLAAGKHGQLQYLKKGSAVMPADISANLIEWGKLDPNALSMPTLGGGVNIMSNAVIQPNYEFNFDSLVHVDHCDEGTLKGLEKMVDNKLDYFSKQLNYSLKKFAR